MPRYFFHAHNGQDAFDRLGTELTDVKAVHLHMLGIAMAMIEVEDNRQFQWQLEALDESGKIVGTLEFGTDRERE